MVNKFKIGLLLQCLDELFEESKFWLLGLSMKEPKSLKFHQKYLLFFENK